MAFVEPDYLALERIEAAEAAARNGHQVEQPRVDFTRLRPGGSWILDAPEQPPAVWGSGAEVLWAQGESLFVTGPPGVGKTTLEAQLVAGRLGLRSEVLGWPIEAEQRGRVLLLAADRPQQIRRAFGRLFTEDQRAALNERLVIWPGPPPSDFATTPHLLLQLAREAGAQTVFLDSLKDMAVGLASDEVGAGLNRALQLASADGIELVALHHQRKGTSEGGRPKKLEDLYGSTWLSAGAGSVLLLWGQAGDPVVEVHHLKQPAFDIGPLQIEHDHEAGTSRVVRGFDLYVALRHAPHGLTATDTARMQHQTETPTEAQRTKAERALKALVAAGRAHRTDPIRGGAGGTQPATYHAIDTHHGATP